MELKITTSGEVEHVGFELTSLKDETYYVAKTWRQNGLPLCEMPALFVKYDRLQTVITQGKPLISDVMGHVILYNPVEIKPEDVKVNMEGL